jgi:hypothetical protein
MADFDAMKVLDVERFCERELLAALRTTRLHGFEGARLYAEARLELARACDPAGLAPSQRYVLSDRVRGILGLRAALLDHGVDLFALDGGAWIRTSEAPHTRVPVIPPVVEISRERDGRLVPIISDGMHRVFAAQCAGTPITVVLARGVPERYPYYAYALEGGWADVAELDELPDGFQKKEYRIPTGYRALFRLYDDVFPGVQERRKATNPAHLVA